jgi:pantoate--beta-alanine ligase
MKIINSPTKMKSWSSDQLKKGLTIGLVPTMGFFHEGHLSLMRRAGELSDLVVVSLFVNPIQFGVNEDLSAYPRNLERDTDLAIDENVAVLFVPAPEEIYPEPPKTRVTVADLTEGLCGRTRPGHFDGVCTVVAKLFNIVKPSLAVFGNKDFQQLAVIRRMVADLNWEIEIIGHPIVRESDGLAMSSRNSYLSATERSSALALYKAIERARQMAGSGVTRTDKICAELEILINSHDNVAIEYLTIVDRHDLTGQLEVNADSLLAMAVVVGKTRLIDNSLLLTEQGD